MTTASHCVRIIHSTGIRAKANSPMIKDLTDSVLRHWTNVLAFASTPALQDGPTAMIVLSTH